MPELWPAALSCCQVGQSDTSCVTFLVPTVWRLPSTMGDKLEPPGPRHPSSFVYPVRSLLDGIQPAGSPEVQSKSTISSLPSEHCFGHAHPSVEQRSSDADLEIGLTNSFSGSYIDSAKDSHNLQSLSSGQLSNTMNVTSARDIGEPSGIYPFPTRCPSDFQSLSSDGESFQQSLPAFSSAGTSPSSPAHGSMMGYSKQATLGMAQENFEKLDLTHSSSTTMSISMHESPCSMNVDTETTVDHLGGQDVLEIPLNPSECGFVHLPPIFTSSGEASSTPNAPNHSGSHLFSAPDTRNRPTTSESRSSGASRGQKEASTDTTVYSTFRFQHAQDEHGHHVIVGREGELRRCEDEVNIASVE